MKTIEEIRKAFLAMHHYATRENAPTYMSVPADRERDADLILSDAIDELEKLRANENAPCWAALGEIEGMLGISGSVPVTTAARAIEKLKADHTAAKDALAREKRITAKALESLLNRWPLPEELEPSAETAVWHEILGQIDCREDRINDLEWAAHQVLVAHPDEMLEKLLSEDGKRVYATAKELTAAKADAARLREELIGARERICEIGVGEESDSPAVAKRLLGQSEEALGAIDAALAATDSVEWLAKHDAELVLNMREQNDAGLVAMNDSLTKQLNAATNDAARAELRARDLADALREHMHVASSDFDATFGNRVVKSFSTIGGVLQVFDGVPDSDARLREVMRRVAHKVQQRSLGNVLTESELVEVVEKELRGAP